VFKYGINVIKKLKTVGKDTKVCPTCRNGKHKKLTCGDCKTVGHVPIEPVKPFERHYYRVNPSDYRKLEYNRIRMAQEITAEGKKTLDEYCYPMNCKSCPQFGGCSMNELCHETEGKWWDPPDVLLADMTDLGDDYVDDYEAQIKEELY
jgi:hypothetical protein